MFRRLVPRGRGSRKKPPEPSAPRWTALPLAILLESLKALQASAAACPPLSSAVGGALYICGLVEVGLDCMLDIRRLHLIQPSAS